MPGRRRKYHRRPIRGFPLLRTDHLPGPGIRPPELMTAPFTFEFSTFAASAVVEIQTQCLPLFLQ